MCAFLAVFVFLDTRATQNLPLQTWALETSKSSQDGLQTCIPNCENDVYCYYLIFGARSSDWAPAVSITFVPTSALYLAETILSK